MNFIETLSPQARLAPELRIGKCLYVDGRQPFQIGEV